MPYRKKSASPIEMLEMKKSQSVKIHASHLDIRCYLNEREATGFVTTTVQNPGA
tara:strand:+ start:933 stop:1094 length:162 start_codon:yes stop_codon:yes gene_type:complete